MGGLGTSVCGKALREGALVLSFVSLSQAVGGERLATGFMHKASSLWTPGGRP